MFDSDLSPRELNEKFDWQAVKKIVAGSDKTDGEIIKENIKKYGGFFGKVIKEINGNEPTGKVLKETKNGDNINENKKRVAQIQGSRGDDDSEGNE
ncbi:unnamed protein product [Rhizophagus irregularis]|nr:unnamed protein product [Rhizophagus irregularis]